MLIIFNIQCLLIPRGHPIGLHGRQEKRPAIGERGFAVTYAGKQLTRGELVPMQKMWLATRIQLYAGIEVWEIYRSCECHWIICFCVLRLYIATYRHQQHLLQPLKQFQRFKMSTALKSMYPLPLYQMPVLTLCQRLPSFPSLVPRAPNRLSNMHNFEPMIPYLKLSFSMVALLGWLSNTRTSRVCWPTIACPRFVLALRFPAVESLRSTEWINWLFIWLTIGFRRDSVRVFQS